MCLSAHKVAGGEPFSLVDRWQGASDVREGMEATAQSALQQQRGIYVEMHCHCIREQTQALRPQ